MQKPSVKIIEQPASKAIRFRYQCEAERSAGSIPGVNSTRNKKTYPGIQVIGYKGPALVLVSCVTKDAPYRPHPHNLVGRKGCNKGVCTLEIPQDTMSITFSNLGIQCVKRKDIVEYLDVRKSYKIDPFGTGFQHKNQPTSIDLTVVRLCFQVFITNASKNHKKFTVPLTPVVSDPIYDKKASLCDLTIVKLSDCVSIVDGGHKDIILLCEKVAKEDIEIRFFEEHDGHIIWEANGDFQPSQVHRQTAIWFRAPKYRTLDIIEPVRVWIQLRRPSDGATSEPLAFEMLPLDSGIQRKRKLESEENIKLVRPLEEHSSNRSPRNIMKNQRDFGIKKEPIDAQPYATPAYLGHNPSNGNPSVSPSYYPPGPVADANSLIPQPYYYHQLRITHINYVNRPEVQWNVPRQGPSQSRQTQMHQHHLHQAAQQPATVETPMAIDSSGLNQILNFDQHLLDSSDLAQYSIDLNALSANLSNSLTISDQPPVAMTSNSLSKLAEATYQNYCMNNLI